MFTNHRAYRDYLMWPQYISDRNYENYQWLEDFYTKHPEYDRPEWLDHYFDEEYWSRLNRPNWRDWVREYGLYIVAAVVIVLLLR